MYYHALCRILGGHQAWSNLNNSDLFNHVLIPFVNRQVIAVPYGPSRAIMNMVSVTYLRVFRTEAPLSGDTNLVDQLLSPELASSECTEEILREARLDRAWLTSRSVLQAALTPESNLAFVVMNFDDHELKEVYESVIRPTLEKFGYSVLRIDEVQDSGFVTMQILEAIGRSGLVVSELSGERPNCYYETGYAHALGKELVLIVRDGEKIHFNLKPLRFIEWMDSSQLREKLTARLQAIKDRRQEAIEDETIY